MTYKVFIKKDYKPVVRWAPDRPWYLGPKVCVPAFAGFFVASSLAIISPTSIVEDRIKDLPDTIETVSPFESVAIQEPDYVHLTPVQAPDSESSPLPALEVPVKSKQWDTVTVSSGDNLSLIFDRMKIPPSVLHAIMNVGKETRPLKKLLPGQELRFDIDDGKLVALEYDQDILTTLQINYSDEKYTSRIIKSEPERKIHEANAHIDSSLFLAGQKAGLSDNLIMQLVAIYGWDIDFALDIRKGDRFKVIYEEQYKGNIKISEGPVLAAEFTNRNKTYRAVRYTFKDGKSDYFSDDGSSMRKAFLRTPLNFTRISSGFSLNRKHPVLNTIRAHKGVDYAAPSGTPIKAAGDGTIISMGTNGGYGKTVVIKHGGNYSTLYAHLSGYAKKLAKGTRVSQGQTIGYVGKSGLATGPHLHYEFRVNGVHRNPLTVSLPKADSIPKALLADFRVQTAPLFAQLDGLDQQTPTMIATREIDPLETVLPETY